jgi:hypothetical protein
MFWKNRASEPPTPEQQDLVDALETLRATDQLCYFNLTTTNAGVAMELSFNRSEVRSGANTLVVALRDADLHFSSATPDAKWAWSEGVTETAKTLVYSSQTSSTETESASLGRSANNEAKFSARAKAALGLVGLDGQTGLAVSERNDTRRDSGRETSRTTSDANHQLTLTKPRGAPRLHFSAPPGSDLEPLNAHLTHVPLFDSSEGDLCPINTMEVTLKLRLDNETDGLRHAFAIKRATGVWATLGADPAKTLLCELLVSKFLIPLHDDQRLWPKDVAHDAG